MQSLTVYQHKRFTSSRQNLIVHIWVKLWEKKKIYIYVFIGLGLFIHILSINLYIYIYIYSGEHFFLSPADFVHLPTDKEMISL